MSDTIFAALIGAAVAIIAAIISGVFSYRAGVAQSQRDEREKLISSLSGLLIPPALGKLQDVENRNYMLEQARVSEQQIKILWLKGRVDKKPQLMEASDKLSDPMRKYVEKFEQYSAPGSQITEEEIESLRQEIKRELGDILGSIQIS